VPGTHFVAPALYPAMKMSTVGSLIPPTALIVLPPSFCAIKADRQPIM
jgi:hypothetical protein